MLVVGGGVTGAGVLRACALTGLKGLLLEQGDFASGTSSASSKLVHGGLRYLQQRQFKLSYESISERERLLKSGPGLVERISLLYATHRWDPLPRWATEMGLGVYGLLAFRTSAPYRRLGKPSQSAVPFSLKTAQLTGLYEYWDAQTDDCRLVLRLLREAQEAGATVMNYVKVVQVLKERSGRIAGVAVEDRVSGAQAEVQADIVLNASGPWGDHLRQSLGKPARLRPLRGSHLVVSRESLPIQEGVFYCHPADGRFVFALPWMGSVLVGSTELDHPGDLSDPVRATREEVSYLREGVTDTFDLPFPEEGILSSFAGVRPVIRSGHALSPSQESREHAIWLEDGLLTVTGGKLTTYSLIARDAIRALKRAGVRWASGPHPIPLNPTPTTLSLGSLSSEESLPLVARYGASVLEASRDVRGSEWELVAGTPYRWVDLRWGIEEGCVHLDDLLLRRTRIGLLAERGGQGILDDMRELVCSGLGWDGPTWEREVRRYVRLWEEAHHPLGVSSGS